MSEQHIHIHIGSDSKSEPQQVSETPTNRVGQWYNDLLRRVKQCYDWKSLYELREDFNSIGLAVRETAGNRKILCRLEEGKPITDKIIDDYIFVGSKNTMDEEIGTRAQEVILHFISQHASKPQVVVDDNQSYSRDVALYGRPIRIDESPKLEAEVQQIEIMSRLIDEDPNGSLPPGFKFY
jgi:hypothetical protein